MNNWIGKAIIAIGVIHNIFGLFFLRSVLADLFNEHLINTVNGQPDREAFFWFLATGSVLIILGALIQWMEKNDFPFPQWLGWTLLGMTIIMVVIMPMAGTWLMLLPAIGSILKYNRSLSFGYDTSMK